MVLGRGLEWYYGSNRRIITIIRMYYICFEMIGIFLLLVFLGGRDKIRGGFKKDIIFFFSVFGIVFLK